jgi:hypothetical protein
MSSFCLICVLVYDNAALIKERLRSQDLYVPLTKELRASNYQDDLMFFIMFLTHLCLIMLMSNRCCSIVLCGKIYHVLCLLALYEVSAMDLVGNVTKRQSFIL